MAPDEDLRGFTAQVVEQASAFEPSPDHADMVRALAALPVGQREAIVYRCSRGHRTGGERRGRW